MPSWQARLLSTFMRFYFKRPLAAIKPGEEHAAVGRIRQKMSVPRWLVPPLPEGTRITPVNEPSQHGEGPSIRGEWVEFANHPQSVIYLLHGGAYVAGSPQTYRAFTTALAEAANARVFALDYRLAPEHQFPAPVEDAVAGYRWLLAQGVDPERLIIIGDSAGGGLTLATLVALRDQGIDLPRAAICLSPWTDLAATGASLETNGDADPMFNRLAGRNFAPVYLGDASPTNPLASPLYADLRGLPPLLVYVGSTEVLLDDAVRLVDRARAAGVEAELRIGEEMIHVWPIFISVGLPEARATIGEMAQFIQQQLARTPHQQPLAYAAK